MDTTEITEYMQRFQDDGYKTWIKTTMILDCLKTRLGVFLENETDAFHTALNGNIKSKQTKCTHQPKCEFRSGKTNQVPLCSLCDAWRNAILAKHTTKNMVYWNNSTPHLWPSHKWEVAKVYMPRGNQKHKSVDDFDISAFLNLMTFCKHFQNFVTTQLLSQVTYVRNQIMHSASFKVSAGDFQQYVRLIRDLGDALGAKIPEFKNFSKDIAEVQNIDFQLQFLHSRPQLQSTKYVDNNKYGWNKILNMELQIMKDKMECLSQNSRSGAANVLTSEDLQMVRSFLNVNHDLQEKLKPQWQRLEAVQAQQGQQINMLTDRVGQLEKHTAAPSEEFSTQTMMYKSHLYERARKYKWPEPAFSHLAESTGFRGQVEVNGESFLGSQVCNSKTQAHQEVAKVALQMLATVMANEDAALGQANQSHTVSQAGPSFFAAVTFGLDVDVSPGVGGSAPVDRMENAYEKLVSLFGLEPPDTGSSNKEKVMKYCAKLNVLPPVARSSAGGFVLRLKGQITFHDWEGSNLKAKAEQQAAKAALEALCGVFAKAEVFKDNHKGTLKELLEGSKQPEGPKYRVTEGPAGHGERIVWRPAEDVPAGPAEGRPDGGHGNEEVGGTEEGPLSAIVPPMKRTITEGCHGPSKMTKVLPPTVGSCLADDGRFLSSVQVTIQVDLRPRQAADQEGAVGAAYSYLMKALSLIPASTSSVGEEREAVLEFFRQTQCPPPVEEIDPTPNGAYRCSLRIDGKLTFQSSERAATKKESEHLAARKALTHLEGLRTVTDLKQSVQGEDNYKGRLQELVADLANSGAPVYLTTDAGTATDDGRFLSSVQVTVQVDLGPRQAADQEGAVGAAYSDLMEALSLILAVTPRGGERQAVLEFFRQTQCPPPVEEIDPTPNGAYRCSLRIDGKLTFQSSERAATKKESEHLAARKALTHLEGLRTVTDLKQPVQGEDNYKGRLQELVADLANSGAPVYLTTDAGTATDDGRFSGSVQVTVQVDLGPHQAADQEGAVGAAYSDLMEALSLIPAVTPRGGERQAVLEFFRQTQCPPPVEDIEEASNGTYQCALKINGQFTFQSPEGSSTKKEAEKLAARQALRHLQGLLSVDRGPLPAGDNYKGLLQELLMARLGSAVPPKYWVVDGHALHPK